MDHLYCKNCSNLEEKTLIYHRPFGGDCIVDWGLDGIDPNYLEENKPKMRYCPYCGNRLL